MMPVHEELLREFQGLGNANPTAQSVMERISQRLHEKITRYNWVGFYLVDATDPGVLLVGPFVGSFTPNRAYPSTRDSVAPQRAAGNPWLCMMFPKIRAILRDRPW